MTHQEEEVFKQVGGAAHAAKEEDMIDVAGSVLIKSVYLNMEMFLNKNTILNTHYSSLLNRAILRQNVRFGACCDACYRSCGVFQLD